ncbi:unnamed protein product [Arabidopsis thaliana]|uniref:Cupin type-1 domain-containing protein n=3 Tax=Arabidopsis TaxID=3701 RepID=A0A654G6F6_ARATH|nr:RmlC-like cupins superfamily protein [Arabidopsis thaliana]AED94378.1 RmlC-like cupins superfamily protein [Arabidopsis thaliana]KAG7611172.1 RmlC-like cupin domain superfamily [Arabidopsis suecica]CAA0406230.1 unnamed protein product [Arabidopsis thaliana]VYS68667.1 unnamed protein product [Arabidopsis thaliana]|eukprot:NP_198711.1 RmlC-like cupins superfamily protein [Arabidopsis thaliana]
MGDVFVFPEGFIHFQFNVGRSPAVAFAALSSQNPGVISIVNTVFGSNPPTNLNVLAKGFQLDPRVAMLMDLQAKILIMKYEIDHELPFIVMPRCDSCLYFQVSS